MNNTSQILSFSRLGMLIQHELNINRPYYLLIIPVFMISLMAILYYFIASSIYFGVMNYIPFLAIGYFIMCFFLMGRSIPALKNKYSSTIYLTLPASSLEKTLVQWLFRLVLPLILYPILFWVTANLTVELYQVTQLLFNSSIWVEIRMLNIEKFGFYRSGIYNSGMEPLHKLTIIASYIALPSIFLLGSIAFTKWANIKAAISFLFIGFLYVSFLVLLSHLLYPDVTQGFQVKLNLGPQVTNDAPLIIIIAILFICLIPIITWTASYWKLKEREV